jgi:tRNA nucleotidyltransferase (CCA-adding enzyme)
MAISDILKEARKLAVPSKKEEIRVNSLVKEVLQKLNSELAKQKLGARIIVGGSVAKGTWLPGISDIDFFIIFNYDRFVDRSTELSDFAESALKKVFTNLKRLHGSRDYFSIKHKNYSLEFVPVLDISKGQQARNITDYSPSHINWILKKAKKKDDIRITKQFLKAAGVYGAESYISGFSGHVVDLLVSHYGTFEKFIRAAASWKLNTFIDPARTYKDKRDAVSAINAAKIAGPLILIDPVEHSRNAAAALEKEKFEKLIKACRDFIKKPDVKFFREKHITLESLIAKKGKRYLIVFEIKAPIDKPDIIGAKMRTLFETLQKRFTNEDFIIKENSWHFGNVTRFWFYFDAKPLSAKKFHFGPPVKLAKEHIIGFKKAWKGHKISVKNKRYVVELKRKFTNPKDFAKVLAKEFKLKLIHS